uniref:CBM-cenC domain-containing protein n=1 Tax=candidate division WOR-3 bacterium TaxID=2052148 RepID=A0A7C4YI24_UNCW3
MKRFFVLFLFFVLVLGAQELLQNNGFESWTGGMPDYWTKSSGITVSQEGTIVHSGTYSVKIYKTSTVTENIQQKIDVDPNTQYNFSFYTYTDKHIRVRLWLKWYNASGTNVRSDPSPYSNPSNANVWQYVDTTIVSPSDADSLEYQVRFYNWSWGDSITSATCYVDDVSCFKPGTNQFPVIENITLSPYAPYPNLPETISCTITDPDGNIVTDSLYYSIDGGSYNVMTHSSVNGSTYSYNLPALPELSKVNYYIVGIDNEGARTQTSIKTYKVYYPVSVNLLNKGFENWTDPNTPENWTVEDPSYVTATQSTDYVNSGVYSCKLSRIQIGNYGIWQKIKVNPRDTIVVVANFYDNDPDVSGRLWFRRIFWDGTTSNVFADYTTDGTGWQMIAETLALPDEIDSLTVLVRVYTQTGSTGDSLGDIYLDNMDLRSISGIPEENKEKKLKTYIITNGIFSLNTGKTDIVATLFDLSGRIIEERFFKDGLIRFELRNKENGIYFVKTGDEVTRIVNLR